MPKLQPMVDLDKTRRLLRQGREGSGKKDVGKKYSELDHMAKSPIKYIQYVMVSAISSVCVAQSPMVVYTTSAEL